MEPENEDDIGCSEPELGRQVFGWALRPGSDTAVPEEQVLASHLGECRYCRQQLVPWKKQAEAARLAEDARRIVAGRLLPQERVSTKQTSRGMAYFSERGEASEAGTLIVVDQSGVILGVDAAAIREDFEKL